MTAAGRRLPSSFHGLPADDTGPRLTNKNMAHVHHLEMQDYFEYPAM